MKRKSLFVQYFNLDSIGGIEDLNEFYLQIKLIAGTVCERSDASKEQKRSRLSAELLEYVNGGFRDCGISLESMAFNFGLSASHASRFFKQSTGYTFIQYVTMLRMDYIKNRLVNTDVPIKEIVTEAGYLDVASFMRKFKASEGVTPGQYRSRYSEGSLTHA